MPSTPTLPEVLAAIISDDRSHLHVALPARVESYDASKQTATVTPTLLHTTLIDGERVTTAPPSIPDVPVAWPRGGGYFLTLPLAQGDTGLIVFAERDIGAWRSSGAVSDAGDDTLHGLGGAVFYPGLHTVAGALANADAGTGHAVLGKASGPQVHVDATGVKLGSASAAKPLVDGTALTSWITGTLLPALAGAPGGSIVVGAPSGILSTKHAFDA